MEILSLLAVGFVVGLVLGSFVTMLSYRLPRGLSIVKPPSHCPSCDHPLEPRDLVPIFSWFFNGRKCRFCKEPIGIRYPLIELITALAVMDAFLMVGVNFGLIIVLGLIVAVVTAVTIKLEKDLKNQR